MVRAASAIQRRGFNLIQFRTKSTHRSAALACRREFPRHWLHRITALALSVCTALCVQDFDTKSLKAESIDRPNVLVVLTDDQGWGDLSLHGNPNLQTPNIDSLARDGVELTNFFVCAVCSPTRAELLTGRYHTRMGVVSTSQGGERFDLKEQTIGDVFHKAGYSTAAYGKWHSGTQAPYHPNSRGFEDFYGFCSGHWGNYFSPMLEHNGRFVNGRGFIVDDLTDRAIERIRSADGKPFFIYLPLPTPHSPMQVPDEEWSRFESKEIVPDPAPANRKKEQVGHTRAALALCENIDANVGRLLETVKDEGVADDTIVVFFCDNGPNRHRFNGGYRGRKGSVHEGGLRSPCLVRYPARLKAGRKIEDLAGAIDLLPTLADLCGLTANSPAGPLDGESLADRLTEDPTDPVPGLPERMIFTKWGESSVRTSRWRAMEDGELYDVVADPGETTDVSAEYPEVADRLQKKIRRWLRQTQAEHPDGPRLFPIGHPSMSVTHLPARDADLQGGVRRSNRFPNCTYVTSWTSPQDAILWQVDVQTPGRYEVFMKHACPPSAVGTRVKLSFAARSDGDTPGSQSTASTDATVEQAFDGEFLSTQFDRWPRQESYVKEWTDVSLGRVELPGGPGVLRLKAYPPEDAEKDSEGVEMRLLWLRRLSEPGGQAAP